MTRQAVLAYIEENEPVCAADITEALGLKHSTTRRYLSCLHIGNRGPKRIYISEYLRTEEFGRCYPRPMYRIGTLPDAAKPKPMSRKEYNARHRRLMKTAVNSVFAMSLPRKERRSILSVASGIRDAGASRTP